MKKLIAFVFVVSTFLLFSSSSYAFKMGACHDDIQKYCHGVQVGENRIKTMPKEEHRQAIGWLQS